MNGAAQAWTDLSPPWRAAFDEAWASWRQGSLAVGAAVVDGDDRVVARGHNQLFHSGPGPISSTHMAHAEMNALAQLPVGRGSRLCVYSSYEPCAMCTSALLFYQVERIAFASVDPVWRGMHDWFRSAPWAARHPFTYDCLGGELGAFGYVLHVSKLAGVAPNHVLDAHREATPGPFDVATSPDVVGALHDLAATDEGVTTDVVLGSLWTELVGLEPVLSLPAP